MHEQFDVVQIIVQFLILLILQPCTLCRLVNLDKSTIDQKQHELNGSPTISPKSPPLRAS